MNTKEAIFARRTVHKFADAEVPRELLHRALEAALVAPNHKHTFPWRFVNVGPETRGQLVEIACRIEEEKKGEPLSPESREKKAEKLLAASALVVFCCKKSDDPYRAKEDYASLACSIQNFSLYLVDAGWGSKWSTGGITTHPETYRLLGVDAEAFEIVGFVWVGKSATELPSQRRPELGEVLSEKR